MTLKNFKSKKNFLAGVFILVFVVVGVAIYYQFTKAGTLSSPSVAPNTSTTDDLIGRTNAQWKFTMTNDTALSPGDVVQVTFPTMSEGPPFTFSSPAVTATTNITVSPTVAVGGEGNLTLGFVLAAPLAGSTTFSITTNGVNNPIGGPTNFENKQV